uniref:nucleoside kinase n=1 Tax=Candidatus Ventrenecus sp. TaxID=3085654 RepID=UPI003FED873D
MKTFKVTVDGQSYEADNEMTFYDIVHDIKPNTVLVKVNGEVFSLDTKIKEECEIIPLDVTSLPGYKSYQSGLKFLFFLSVKELFPEAKLSFLHSVPKGILSEVILNHELTNEDVSKIKGQMALNVSKKLRYLKYNIEIKDAYDYFMKKGEIEKAKNLQTLNNPIVTLYRLGNELNYFYTLMPYDTSVINLYELVFLGNNRIVLVCPNVTSGLSIPEYVHYENIVTNFMETKKWLSLMNASYVSLMNELVSSSKIKNFIASNEILFVEDILKACDTITASKDIKIVLIAGPSSSGKTTTMKRLSSFLQSRGLHPIGLSTDDFFVDREDTPKNEKGEYDYECLEAIDLKLFNDTLQGLLDGKEVEIPEYDFVAGKKVFKGRKCVLDEKSILIVEGLHCLNDDLTPYIDERYKYKIYLSPFIPLNIDRHNYISTLDLRLIRRIVRDNRTRGKNVNQTIGEWQVVRSGEEKYIFPYVYQADRIINTALAYEIGVLKIYAVPLLSSVDIRSPYYNEARRLINYMQTFYTIPSEYVPKDSILREFIG